MSFGLRFVMALILGALTADMFSLRGREEDKLRIESLKPGRQVCLIEPMLLPVALAMGMAFFLLWGGVQALGRFVANLWLLFLQIGVYYALLLLALAPLRRAVSARACAALWLVPGLLYFLVWIVMDDDSRPLAVLTLPKALFEPMFAVWLLGFLGLLVWQMVSHLQFRRLLLRDAVPERDEVLLEQWHAELRRHGVRRDIPVVVSRQVSTPLTVGCFLRTMRLVLPGRHYSREELELIFCHELRHIVRRDTRTKLFLGFCTALCWFNPLCWIARRRASDDLELSCDEAVLEDADEATRRRYAELLLQHGASGRGCTTCLSGAAQTLRYRLSHVMKPAKRLSGGLLVGAAAFVLTATAGTLALADAAGPARELLFEGQTQTPCVQRVFVSGWREDMRLSREVFGFDEAALTGFLGSLRIREIYAGAQGREQPFGTRCLDIDYKIPGQEGLIRLTLSDGLLIADLPDDGRGEIACLVEEEIDWQALDAMLDFEAPDPDPDPRTPVLDLWFSGCETANQEHLSAQSRTLFVRDAEGIRVPEQEDFGVGGVFGLAVTQVRLEFEPEPRDYTVTVENWDRSLSYTVQSSELEDGVLPLAPYSAHYTVRGGFDSFRQTYYQMEFFFDVGLPGEEAVWGAAS